MPGAEEAAAQLRAMSERLRDMSPLTRAIAADLRTFIDDRFRTGTDPDGRPWRPLSQTTIDRRRRGRGRGSPQPLLDTGRLRGSITAVGTDRAVVFGTNVVYAPTHQFGRSDNLMFGRTPAPIPARPFLPISDDGLRFRPSAMMERIREAALRWLETGELP